jgi:drug/metabolite transporter (DMT)-like permease
MTLALLSAASFGTAGPLGSALLRAGWSPAAAVTARIALAALLLTGPALVSLRGRWAMLRRQAGQVAGYGLVAVAGAQFAYFSAVQRIPVGIALMLEYLGVVLVVAWLWLRHGQRPQRLTVAGAVAALTGLAMVLNLAGPARLSLVGVGWALLAAVGLATYFLQSASADAEPLPPIVMAWSGMSVGAAALGGLGYAGLVRLTVTSREVGLFGHRVSWIVPLLGLSLVAAVIAYLAGIGAARRLGARLASFAGLSEVLFAVLLAWVLLGQLPAGLQFAGGALILAGVTLVRADELRHGLPAQRAQEPGDHGTVGRAALAAVDGDHREGDAAAETDQPGVVVQPAPGSVLRRSGLGVGPGR